MPCQSGLPDLGTDDQAVDLSPPPDLLAPTDLSQPCGALGQRCCPGHPAGGHEADFCTDAQSVCVAALCAACGADGQPCCDGNQCAQGGCCDHSASPRGTCIGAGGVCPNGAGNCAAGLCDNGSARCGDTVNGPCAGGTGCTAPSTVLTTTVNGDACAPCGAAGAACCLGANGGWCGNPLACAADGTCGTCGSPARQCCRSSTCIAPNMCIAASGTCG
jgi:hypothetical protein